MLEVQGASCNQVTTTLIWSKSLSYHLWQNQCQEISMTLGLPSLPSPPETVRICKQDVNLTYYSVSLIQLRQLSLSARIQFRAECGMYMNNWYMKGSDVMQLHEVMEQQTVSVAKAGIIATLNARTSVLASANPVGSRYNPRLSVIDNIHLPPSLLSRFDLIYLVLDKAQEASDRKLARHLVSLYYEHQDPRAQVCIFSQCSGMTRNAHKNRSSLFLHHMPVRFGPSQIIIPGQFAHPF